MPLAAIVEAGSTCWEGILLWPPSASIPPIEELEVFEACAPLEPRESVSSLMCPGYIAVKPVWV